MFEPFYNGREIVCIIYGISFRERLTKIRDRKAMLEVFVRLSQKFASGMVYKFFAFAVTAVTVWKTELLKILHKRERSIGIN